MTNGKTAVNEVEEGGLRASFNFFFKRAILATAQGIFFYRGHHHRHNNHQVIQTRAEQNGTLTFEKKPCILFFPFQCNAFKLYFSWTISPAYDL